MQNVDKTCIITGATSGIGKETAAGLAKQGVHIVMTSRDLQKGLQVKEELVRRSDNQNVDVMECNLASFDSIARFCQRFREKYSSLHILINNAGVWETRFSMTIDDIETTFAVNHLAPFLMTNLLLDRIKESRPARIINVSSSMHGKATLNFEDLEGRKRFDHNQSYGQSKLANILFTKLLAQKLKNCGVTVNCLMPGVVRTNLFKNASPIIRLLVRAIWINPQKGAETSIYLANSTEVADVTGEYFNKKKISHSSRESKDMDKAEKLWRISEKYMSDYLDR